MYYPQVAAWELGNELDIPSHSKNVTPALAANDFVTLVKSNLSHQYPADLDADADHRQYRQHRQHQSKRTPMLFGSDPTNSGVMNSHKKKTEHSRWFEEYVGNLTEKGVWLDGLTYHHYYQAELLNRPNLSPTEFFDRQ